MSEDQGPQRGENEDFLHWVIRRRVWLRWQSQRERIYPFLKIDSELVARAHMKLLKQTKRK